MGRDALAELSREQLIELVLALAAEVAKLKARQGAAAQGAGELIGAAVSGVQGESG